MARVEAIRLLKEHEEPACHSADVEEDGRLDLVTVRPSAPGALYSVWASGVAVPYVALPESS